MQSSVPSGCEIPTLADVERGTGTVLPKLLGCDGSADVAACMRGKSPAELVSAIPTSFTVFPRTYGPNMDGKVFVDQPIARIKRREYPAMPVMIGNTAEETMHFIDSLGSITDQATLAGAVTKVFGASSTPRILAEYPGDTYASPRAALVKITTDAEFTCQSRRVARTFASVQTEPVFRYRFNYALQNDAFQKAQGAIHTVEHPFLFAWQGAYQPTATELDMQRQMVGYWSRMAKTGNPNGGKDTAWPAVTPTNSAYLEMGPQMQAANSAADAHCDFWDTVTLPWPHM
jgi:para-nitrobenzyl esterase